MIARKRADFWEGAAIPLRGRVGAVFHRAADVLCGRFLVTLMTGESCLHPLGILIDGEAFARLEPGMPVHLDPDGLHLGLAGLRWEAPVEPVMRPRTRLSAEAALRHANGLRRLLPLAGSRSAVGEAFLGERGGDFAAPLDLLRQALAEGMADLVSVGRWFGGGEGLTPAWDDLCAGLLFADRFFSGGVVAPTASLFKTLSGKTTPQSLWQLRFAESGRSSLGFERFLAALSTGPIPSKEVMSLAGLGHTSGNDLLCGICLWLEAWAARP
ncbi:MAG TPA: DUF2877 domain-containing protein [Candidatus Ozemobacteraceae bacterium]|nr:DUF2877 domain-containing protein [Candidatus Ozemobacteraceae bacterium]